MDSSFGTFGLVSFAWALSFGSIGFSEELSCWSCRLGALTLKRSPTVAQEKSWDHSLEEKYWDHSLESAGFETVA